ncbi:hypothetical protein JXA59_03125 [Patescibacteria group bacterium]|nr:hypothetical protein [Patescibacteria group bacterium]
MHDDEEEKVTSGFYLSRPLLVIGLVVLILGVGIISFVQAGGRQAIAKSWLGWFLPSFSLEIKASPSYLPADGNSTTLIDIVAKDKHGQLIDGSDIEINLVQGIGDLTNSADMPSNVSKQVILRTPAKPQVIIIEADFRGIKETVTVDIFDPAPPAVPTLKAPADKAVITTAIPTISGQGPVGTKVEAYVDDQQNTIFTVDSSGNFAGPLEQAIKRGQHSLKLISINKYGVRSAASIPITIEIRTPDPEIDLANLRIKPNPAKAGEVFYVFVPVSSNTQSVKLMIENTSYALADRNRSSIYSATLRAPTSPGLYPISLIITNQGGDSVLAENIASLKVR